MKTSELTGAALDWAVCVALGRTDMRIDPDDGEMMASDDFDYSTDWYAGNIGRAYNPNKNYVDSYFMEKLQGALLAKPAHK